MGVSISYCRHFAIVPSPLVFVIHPEQSWKSAKRWKLRIRVTKHGRLDVDRCSTLGRLYNVDGLRKMDENAISRRLLTRSLASVFDRCARKCVAVKFARTLITSAHACETDTGARTRPSATRFYFFTTRLSI